MDFVCSTDNEISVRKSVEDYEMTMSTNGRKRRGENKSSFKAPVHNKRPKIELQSIKIDVPEYNRQLPMNDSGEKDIAQEKSKRVKIAIQDPSTKVKNYSEQDNNSESNETIKNCCFNYISDNVIKNLDTILFSEDTDGRVDNASSQSNIRSTPEQKHISSSPKEMNKFKLMEENKVENTNNSSEKENRDDQTTRKALSMKDKHFLLNKTVIPNLDLCDRIKKNEENCVGEEIIVSSEKYESADSHIISLENLKENKDDNNVTEDNECATKYDLIDCKKELSLTYDIQQLQTLSCHKKVMSSPQSPVKNPDCSTSFSKKYLEDNAVEEKVEDTDDHNKNKLLEIPEMSSLVTATDYFKTEKMKDTEILIEEIHLHHEKKSDENIMNNKELNCLNVRDSEKATMLDSDPVTAKNLNRERRDSRENITLRCTESVKEKANEISTFQLNNIPILIDELFGDIKKADAIINALCSCKNTENCSSTTQCHSSKDMILHSLKEDYAEVKMRAKCNENRKESENNINYKNECGDANFKEIHKSPNYGKQTSRENVFVSGQIDKKDVLNENLEQEVVGINLVTQDKKIIAKEIPFDQVKLKSEIVREFLDENATSSPDNSSAKNNDLTSLEHDKETYFSERNISLSPENFERKRSISQNPQNISNDTCVINEDINYEERKQEIDPSDSSNKNLELKEKKLTLMYMSALEYDKNYHTKDADDLNEEKVTEYCKPHTKLLNDFANIDTDTREKKNLEINKQDSVEDVVSYQNQNTEQIFSPNNTNQDLLKDKHAREINKKKFFNIQNLPDTSTGNEIESKNIKVLMYDVDSNKSACNDQIQEYNDENTTKYDLIDSKKELNITNDTRQLQTLSYHKKVMSSLQSPENPVCGDNCSKKYLEDKAVEKEIEETDDHNKNKFLEIPEMSSLVTATDYLKKEKMKGTEISIETENSNSYVSLNQQIDKKAENCRENDTPCSSADDSFDMDDDFDLTASQLIMIEVDEKNHFKEKNQTTENSSEETENCSNTHFNSDSITVEIIDQLYYIRESVESIKELLHTLSKQK